MSINRSFSRSLTKNQKIPPPPNTHINIPILDKKKFHCKVCSRPTKDLCSRCKKVYYCSQDHQIRDWHTHKSKCLNSELRSGLVDKKRQRSNFSFILRQ